MTVKNSYLVSLGSSGERFHFCCQDLLNLKMFVYLRLKIPFQTPNTYVVVLLFFDRFQSIFNVVLILLTIVVWIVYMPIKKKNHFWTPGRELTNITVINWILYFQFM